MRVKVLFFATLRDRAGRRNLEMELQDGMNIGSFKEKISKDIPALQPSMDSLLVAINREYAFDETIIPEGAEIAMFPPVSGG